MIRVIVESPFAGRGRSIQDRWADETENLWYLRAAMRDCLLRGEAPFASHALYTQPGVLDDGIPGERKHGIEAGFAWGEAADKTVVYTDRGITDGMRYGIEHAARLGHPIEYRTLTKENAPRS